MWLGTIPWLDPSDAILMSVSGFCLDDLHHSPELVVSSPCLLAWRALATCHGKHPEEISCKQDGSASFYKDRFRSTQSAVCFGGQTTLGKHPMAFPFSQNESRASSRDPSNRWARGERAGDGKGLFKPDMNIGLWNLEFLGNLGFLKSWESWNLAGIPQQAMEPWIVCLLYLRYFYTGDVVVLQIKLPLLSFLT